MTGSVDGTYITFLVQAEPRSRMWGQPLPAVRRAQLDALFTRTFGLDRSSTSFKLGNNRFVTAQTNLSKLKRVEVLLVLMCLLLACIPSLSQSISAVGGTHGAPHDPQTDAAFEHFYNMDYDRATQEFERILEKHP